jgi:hypothetical protein
MGKTHSSSVFLTGCATKQEALRVNAINNQKRSNTQSPPQGVIASKKMLAGGSP